MFAHHSPYRTAYLAVDIMVVLASLCNDVGYNGNVETIKEPHTKEASTMDYTTFVGFDVHKDTIAVAVAKEGNEEPMSLGNIRTGRIRYLSY